MLHDDPFLDGVACVVFDEFHERGLEADLALGMVRLVRENVRPDLKVVVMSATVDPGAGVRRTSAAARSWTARAARSRSR